MVWYTRLVSKLATISSSSTIFKNIVTTQNHPTLSKFGATNVFRKFTTQNHPTLLKQKHSFSNHLGGYKPPPPLISSNNVFMVNHYRRTYATRPEWLRKMLDDAPINYLNYVIIVLVLIWSTNEMLMHKPDGDNCDETILYTNRTTQGVKIPPRADKVLAERIFNKDKLGLLPEEHPYSVRVKSIGDQIVKALQSDLEAMRKKGGKISADHLDGIKWEFVVTSDTKFTSASVPGGKICVSSDLLKHLESDAYIATIIGHEVGHIVARHDSLRLNRYMKAIDFANKYFGLAISSPKMAEHTPKGLGRLLFIHSYLGGHERNEMEADHIGLLIMASAGFDPQEAPKVYAMLDQLPSLTSGKERAEYLVQAKVMEEAKSIYSKTIESRYTSRMAKTKPGRKDVETCSINGTNKVVRPGDCVLLRPTDSEKAPYVARVEKLEADHRNNIKVKVRCYYRPEESRGGRRHFHGSKELFLSDHYDWQSAHTIEGKCNVHTLKSYTELENVGVEDYFCRFEYKASTGKFIPDRVDVYCKCEMPYNPDVLMVQCEDCEDWFHPSCIGMTIEEASKLEQFVCSVCSSDEDSS